MLIERIDMRLAIVATRLAELTRDGDPLPGTSEALSVDSLLQSRKFLLEDRERHLAGVVPDPWSRIPQDDDESAF